MLQELLIYNTFDMSCKIELCDGIKVINCDMRCPERIKIVDKSDFNKFWLED